MQRPSTFFLNSFPARPLPRQQQRGMALIEVLVSLLLFSFGVLGLIGLEARSINFSVDAEDRNRAALLANEIASSLWLTTGTGNVTVSNAALTAWQARASDPSLGGLPNGNVTITPVAGTTNSVDIVIKWKPPSRTATDDSSTLNTRVILP